MKKRDRNKHKVKSQPTMVRERVLNHGDRLIVDDKGAATHVVEVDGSITALADYERIVIVGADGRPTMIGTGR